MSKNIYGVDIQRLYFPEIFDGKTIDEVLEALKVWYNEVRYSSTLHINPTRIFDVKFKSEYDYDNRADIVELVGSYEESDEEYEARISKDIIRAREKEERELAEFKRLSEKFKGIKV